MPHAHAHANSSRRPGRRVAAAVLAACVVVLSAATLTAITAVLQSRVHGRLAAELTGVRATATALVLARQPGALGEGTDAAEPAALGRRLDAEIEAVGPALAGLDRSLAWDLQQAARLVPTEPAAGSLFTVLDAAGSRATDAGGAAATRAAWAVGVLAVVALAGPAMLGRRLLGPTAASAAADRLADGRLWSLVAHEDEMLLVLGADRSVFYLSPSVEQVLGYTAPALARMPGARGFIHDGDLVEWNETLTAVMAEAGGHRRVVVRVHHQDGSTVHVEADVTNHLDEPMIRGVVVNARDVTDRVALAADLAHQAAHDGLTGLANRRWFADQVTAALRSTADPSKVAVVLLDLDGFKEINDSLGHAAGDDALLAVSARLASLVRHRDRVARLGGDEFAVLVVDDDPLPLARRIVTQLAEPVELPVGPVAIGASVGVAVADYGSTVGSLLRDADAAMYDAKSRGRNRVSVFTAAMHDVLVERLRVRAELDAAIAQEAFALVYQPELDLVTGTVKGFEALLRWPRPDGSVVAPNDFIPLAERTGQIVPIGAWVMRTALAQLAEWRRDLPGGASLTMAVNVSTRQLASAEFVTVVRDALAASGVPATAVTLEITETMLMTDTDDAARVLSELRRLGVRIAVDDYGSGHASIGYLRRLPIDVLKIDRSFVAALEGGSDEAEAYLRSITELARTLRLDTVAEGIEHERQLRQLRELGCTSGQGFHLARPLSPEAAADYLRRRSLRLAA